MNTKRKAALLQLVAGDLNDRDWFDYHDWDGHIECEEDMTYKELEWLQEHCEVIVTVKEKAKEQA